MNKSLSLLTGVLLLSANSLAEENSKETIRLNSSSIVVEANDAKTHFTLWKEKKKIGEFTDRNCMAAILPGKEKRLNNGLLFIVKLDSSNKEYLYCTEEIDLYNYQGLIIGPGKKGKYEVIYSGPARGSFEDFDGDGLKDLLKNGGFGEPVSSTAGAYDPYLVFKQTRKKGKVDFQPDEELSKKFSQSKKFKWHGSKYDSAIIVDKNGEITKP